MSSMKWVLIYPFSSFCLSYASRCTPPSAWRRTTYKYSPPGPKVWRISHRGAVLRAVVRTLVSSSLNMSGISLYLSSLSFDIRYDGCIVDSKGPGWKAWSSIDIPVQSTSSWRYCSCVFVDVFDATTNGQTARDRLYREDDALIWAIHSLTLYPARHSYLRYSLWVMNRQPS